MTPLVSVVIPAFNARAHIARALTSVADQTYRPIEVVLVDDSSTDDTLTIAATRLRESDLAHRIIRSDARSGPARARNKGVAAARGDYVAFLDSDDIWLPTKIEKQVRLMESHSTVTLCGCQALWVPEDGGESYPLFHDLPEIYSDGLSELFWNCYIATPCAMVRRDDLGVAPFDEALRAGEDRDLWLRLASNGAVGLVQDALVHIRTSSNSYMSTHYRVIESDVLPMIRHHLKSLRLLIRFNTGRLAVGKVYADIGRPLCTNESYLKGAPYLLRAALLGYRPLKNLNDLIQLSPALQFLKRQARAVLPDKRR